MKVGSPKIIQGLLYGVLAGSFLFSFICAGQAQGGIKREIMIEVEPNIIALPENIEIKKVPISAVRVRSTELRELNKKYNAVSIERLFKVQQKPKAKQTLRAKGAMDTTKKVIDASKVFTGKKRDELIREGQISEDKEVAEAKNVFLISFEPKTSVNINKIADEYRALPVVRLVESVQ
jgi:hypothetical protein